MQTPEPHRKTVKHFNVSGHWRELTFSCYRRLPLLAEDRHRILLSRAIDAAMAVARFRLAGFVIMPEHVHLIVFPADDQSQVSHLLSAIKRPMSFRVKQDMTSRGDSRLASLSVQERPGKHVFRFWQEGPGYDRNLIQPQAVLKTLEYAHDNPVRRGLCRHPAEWKWSSWHHYYLPEDVDAELPRIDRLPL